MMEEDKTFTLADWRYEVSNGDTYLGYLEWVEHCREIVNDIINSKDPFGVIK